MMLFWVHDVMTNAQYLPLFAIIWQLVSTKNSNIHRPLCTFEIQAWQKINPGSAGPAI